MQILKSSFLVNTKIHLYPSHFMSLLFSWKHILAPSTRDRITVRIIATLCWVNSAPFQTVMLGNLIGMYNYPLVRSLFICFGSSLSEWIRQKVVQCSKSSLVKVTEVKLTVNVLMLYCLCCISLKNINLPSPECHELKEKCILSL